MAPLFPAPQAPSAPLAALEDAVIAVAELTGAAAAAVGVARSADGGAWVAAGDRHSAAVDRAAALPLARAGAFLATALVGGNATLAARVGARASTAVDRAAAAVVDGPAVAGGAGPRGAAALARHPASAAGIRAGASAAVDGAVASVGDEAAPDATILAARRLAGLFAAEVLTAPSANDVGRTGPAGDLSTASVRQSAALGTDVLARHPLAATDVGLAPSAARFGPLARPAVDHGVAPVGDDAALIRRARDRIAGVAGSAGVGSRCPARLTAGARVALDPPTAAIGLGPAVAGVALRRSAAALAGAVVAGVLWWGGDRDVVRRIDRRIVPGASAVGFSIPQRREVDRALDRAGQDEGAQHQRPRRRTSTYPGSIEARHGCPLKSIARQPGRAN